MILVIILFTVSLNCPLKLQKILCCPEILCFIWKGLKWRKRFLNLKLLKFLGFSIVISTT